MRPLNIGNHLEKSFFLRVGAALLQFCVKIYTSGFKINRRTDRFQVIFLALKT